MLDRIMSRKVQKPLLFSHALAHALKMIHQEPNKEQILVVNLSGRGDKDIFTVDKVLKEKGMQ